MVDERVECQPTYFCSSVQECTLASMLGLSTVPFSNMPKTGVSNSHNNGSLISVSGILKQSSGLQPPTVNALADKS